MIRESRVDAADYGQLYREEAPRLWRAMFAFTGDRESANDVVAEAFAQCLRRGAEVRTPALWVWKAAFRIAAGELRDSRRRDAWTLEAAAEDEIPDLDLLAALPRLSRQQRVTLILHYYADYSTTDIATILGISATTVRVHLMQGRRRLRDMLGGTDG
jgi:RNA polymerase sigma-70 factor (ECF subfamily)